MPRTARAAVGDYCYHVINHGNGRAEVFHAEETIGCLSICWASRLRTCCENRAMAHVGEWGSG
jgi:hypothetical protein